MNDVVILAKDFEKRNNLSIAITLFSDGSGNVEEFWNNEKLLDKFKNIEELTDFLKRTEYQLDDKGLCLSPVRLKKKLSMFENLVDFLNKQDIGSIVSRVQLIEHLNSLKCFTLYYDKKPYTASFDVYRRYLTKGGYLEDTNKLGQYKVIRNISVYLSVNQLRKQAYKK